MVRGLLLFAFIFCFQLARFRELLIQIYLDFFFLSDLGCWKLFVAFQLRMCTKVLFSALLYHRPFGNAQRVCPDVEPMG